MKKTILASFLMTIVMSCNDHAPRGISTCAGVNDLDVPHSALFGQWQESEVLEMRSNSATTYWIRKNHVLTREGQLTTREEICADEACIDMKAEFTHFGDYVFSLEHGTLLKTYRKHFYTAHDDKWMRSNFALEKCRQPLPAGDVVPLEHEDCIDVLGVKSQETWKLEGATLKSLALRNCGPQLRASNHLTRELVRMF